MHPRVDDVCRALRGLRAARAGVHGVSTQRPDRLATFAEHAGLPFTLLSDQDEELADACAAHRDARRPTTARWGARRGRRW
ncbi:redoxin domain-containing protein [Geodermatophilus amargosae]|uniref:redoxin domain-containing protein n=1 Tax=Geodermatophilus amargosae TaxID=1296565 RepID=UPI0034DEE689